MDPISLAAISSGVSLVKQLLENCNQAKDIYSEVDRLLGHAEAKPQKPQKRKMLEKWSGDAETGDAVEVVLNQREAARQLRLLENLVNKRFPVARGEQTTWELILDERDAQKVRRQKAKVAAEKKAEADREWWHHALVLVAQGGIVVTAIGALLWFLAWAAQKGGSG